MNKNYWILIHAVIFVSSTLVASADNTSIHVRTYMPSTKVFESRLTVQGSVEAKTSVNVSARVPGNLDSVWVDEGDQVVAGETKMFQIDPVNLSNQVVIAEQALAVAKSGLAVSKANLEKIQAEASKAEKDHARYERLHKEGRVTDNEFELSETQYLSAKAGLSVGKAQIELSKSQVDQASAQLLIARKALADSLITAPISGTVSVRRADPGEFIAAGMPIVTIVNTDDLEAAAFIPAKYFGLVIPGRTEFRLGTEGKELGKFTVSYKSPVVNPSLRTFEIKGNINGIKEIAPGMMADMTLVFNSHEGLSVPSGAVLTRAGKTIVFVNENGTAVKREVTIGLQNDGCTEVTDGLESTEKVIIEGHTLVRDGSAITE